jgi:hypothetical protein
VEETSRILCRLFRPRGTSTSQLDPQSSLFQTKLAFSNPGAPASLEIVRLFISRRRSQARSAYGYVAYAFVMVFGQRHVNLAVKLPGQTRPDFSNLRREVLGFTTRESRPFFWLVVTKTLGGRARFLCCLRRIASFRLGGWLFVREVSCLVSAFVVSVSGLCGTAVEILKVDVCFQVGPPLQAVRRRVGNLIWAARPPVRSVWDGHGEPASG